MSNHLAWEAHTKASVVAMVNTNGPGDAANGRSNARSAQALAYLMNYAMGEKKMKASDILIGTHSNGANVMNEALGILKNKFGRSLSGTKGLIVAPNTTVAVCNSIARQLGNSPVEVYDSTTDGPLLGAGLSGKGKGYINDNHINSTRPGNVRYFDTNIGWNMLGNHDVKNYFKAIEAGNVREYRPRQ